MGSYRGRYWQETVGFSLGYLVAYGLLVILSYSILTIAKKLSLAFPVWVFIIAAILVIGWGIERFFR